MKIIQKSRSEMWMSHPIFSSKSYFSMSAGSNCNCEIQCGCDTYCSRDGSNENSGLTCTGYVSN